MSFGALSPYKTTERITVAASANSVIPPELVLPVDISRKGSGCSLTGVGWICCMITDISTGGVRLHVEGYEVPDDFVLLLCGDELAKECNYQFVWRLGHEIGARFVGLVRGPD
jgi:hypothetical protein